MTEADLTVSGVLDNCFGLADAAVERMPKRIATKNVEPYRTREIRSSSTAGKSTESRTIRSSRKRPATALSGVSRRASTM